METILLIARLLLALVFVAAGVAKLADPKGSRQAIIDFGVPAAIATPLGILLPLAELAVAVALIPASTAWWGAVGALVLLCVFVVGIGNSLARGRKPECHCFGQLHSAPAGGKTLARNAALAAVAGFVVWQGYHGAGPSAVGWLSSSSAARIVAIVFGLLVLGLLVGGWWLLFQVLRQNGRLLSRIEALEGWRLASGDVPSANGSAKGLPVGAQAPDFELPGLDGERRTLDSLLASGKPAMLVFTSSGCGPCTEMLPEIARWQEDLAETLTMSLISGGEPEENRAKSSEHGLRNVLLEDGGVSDEYGVHGTPSAVLVRPDGTIGSSIAESGEAIEALVAYARGYAAAQREAMLVRGPKLGEPAPDLRLADLEGETVDLEDFKGEKTLVLFWSPSCGFCQQILPDLKRWEEDHPEDAPRLLVVAAGAEEANREQGFSSTVVLDQQFAVGRAFGASGTPSAVLVDEEGKVASELALGTTPVLDLTRARQGQA
jgi:thiol-disulfide isomerase/thioredoxin/uncharacterized membrane protein YphA (DoxX/SURF4 family)